MNECLFCNIVKGVIPAEKIYEDDDVFAFLDINPNNKGHTLVIPKTHFDNIYTISPSKWEKVMDVVRRLSSVIKEATNAHGINIHMNNDRAGGQLVFHVHMHIIPRFEDDGFTHWRGTPYAEGEMKQYGDLIRATLSA